MPIGYPYITGSPTGVLYIGVTSKQYERILQHKDGALEGFSKTDNCTCLLYFETYGDIRQAIARRRHHLAAAGQSEGAAVAEIAFLSPAPAYFVFPEFRTSSRIASAMLLPTITGSCTAFTGAVADGRSYFVALDCAKTRLIPSPGRSGVPNFKGPALLTVITTPACVAEIGVAETPNTPPGD